MMCSVHVTLSGLSSTAIGLETCSSSPEPNHWSIFVAGNDFTKTFDLHSMYNIILLCIINV